MDGGAWWLQSMGSLRVRHDWATSLSLFTIMHWRRKWPPTPVFLPGESQGWGSLVGCRLWGLTESDTTEATCSSSSSSRPRIRAHKLFSKVPAWKSDGTLKYLLLFPFFSHSVTSYFKPSFLFLSLGLLIWSHTFPPSNESPMLSKQQILHF